MTPESDWSYSHHPLYQKCQVELPRYESATLPTALKSPHYESLENIPTGPEN